MSDKKTVLFKIKRQPNPDVRPYWEEFELPWHSGMNVISLADGDRRQPGHP